MISPSFQCDITSYSKWYHFAVEFNDITSELSDLTLGYLGDITLKLSDITLEYLGDITLELSDVTLE